MVFYKMAFYKMAFYDMIRALEIPSQVDLSGFSAHLRQWGLPHRISEEGLNQVLWVGDEETASLVRQAYSRFEAGDLDIQGITNDTPASPGIGTRLFAALVRYPVTFSLALASLAFFPVAFGVEEGDFGYLFSQMTFLAIERHGDALYFMSLADTLATGQYWRLLSPMFIHFGLLHLVFNMLWVWEIGRRIEFVNGAAAMLAVVALTSAASNFTQFFMSGPGLFGGMSGVVFGLLGHSLIFSRLVPERTTNVPKAIYIFMLVYLAIGFTGVIDLIGMGNIANGAHLGGLLAGLATGAITGLLTRQRTAP